MKAVIAAHDPLRSARDHGIIRTLMSDLLQVGSQCSLSTCNVSDFLPITCKCTQVFCRDHILPDAHACTAVTTPTGAGAQAGGQAKERLRRCDIEGCNKPTLFAFTTSVERETCEKCRKAFCVECVVHIRCSTSPSNHTALYELERSSHRYPDTHSCTPIPAHTPSSSTSAARAVLEKHFGPNLTASSSRASKARPSPHTKKKPPTDPIKLAQYLKVQLMKMRHSAVSADIKDTPGSVPQGLRLVVGVSYEGQEKAFWFKRSVSTGKAVDLLASQFNVSSYKVCGVCIDFIGHPHE